MSDPVAKRAEAAKFARLIVKGNSPTQAAREMGYAESSASSMGSRLVNSELVKKKITELLDEADLGDSRIVREIGKGLDKSSVPKYAHDVYLDKLIKLRGHAQPKESSGPVIIGKDAALDFCRAYFQAKQESQGNNE